MQYSDNPGFNSTYNFTSYLMLPHIILQFFRVTEMTYYHTS